MKFMSGVAENLVESMVTFLVESNQYKLELRKAGLYDKDSDYEGMLGQSVEELMDVFLSQEHSGFSAALVSSIFKELVDGKSLTPLSGDDDEWLEVTEYFENDKKILTFQNIRMGSVFKTTDEDGNMIEAHDIDGGPIFRDPDGCTYTSSDSFLDITFPYTPPKEREIVGVSESIRS